MTQTAPRRQVLCYDIADDRRRDRVRRRVCRDGRALQYSLFECTLGTRALQALIADLQDLIDAREDDIRVYGPRQDAPVIWLGPAADAEGVQFLTRPRPAPRVPADDWNRGLFGSGGRR